MIENVQYRIDNGLTDEEFVKNFFTENKGDALVNLFALNHHVEKGIDNPTLMDISIESFKKYMEVNLVSLFSVCREFSKNVLGNGSIVNFSSTYGVVSPISEMYNGEKHIGYSVSKAGVIMLTKHLATHLAPKIRTNVIIPGGVENTQSSEFKKDYSSRTPMKRMMAVNELNEIIEYLISDKSSYTTGSEFRIDGGWTAW